MLSETTSLLSLSKRAALLQQTQGFSALPPEMINDVANKIKELYFSPGEIIVKEGEKGENLIVVTEGKAEMTVSKATGAVPIALFTSGEFFGASCLLDSNNVHSGTITALTKVHCYTLEDTDFDSLTSKNPRFKNVMEQFERDIKEAKFLKLATPFLNLSAEQTECLARSIELIECKKGDALYSIGEKESDCYLVFRGKIEIILPASSESGEKRLGILWAGALLGEVALLTNDSFRTETAMAVEDSQLLVMHRSELIKVMREDVRTYARIAQVMQMKVRPRRIKEVEIFDRKTASGNSNYILKNPATFKYFKLSPEGLFIWNQLDGNSSVRDITLSFYKEYNRFAPEVISEVMTGLTTSGFLQTPELDWDVELSATAHITWKQRIMLFVMRLLEWKVTFNNVDRFIGKAYKKVVWIAYTKVAQLLFIVISLCGMALFMLNYSKIYSTMHTMKGKDLLLLIPLFLLAILLHEAGHAFTVKAKGYQVPNVGFGWYWYGPMAFVNTSDTWLATARERIAVSFAGPYMNLISGGIAIIIAAIFPHTLLATACLLFAFISYAIVLINFNPLLEYDGYYILMDWMDYPNLRSHSLRWFGQNYKKAFWRRSALNKKRYEAFYAIGTIGYSIFMSISIFFFYRDYIEKALAQLLPHFIAEGIGWFLGIAVLLVSIMGIISQAKK